MQTSKRPLLPDAAQAVLGRIGTSARLAAAKRYARRALAEVKLRDPWVYTVFSGQRFGGQGPLTLHYLGRRRFAGDFLAFFERQSEEEEVAQSERGAPGLGALWSHSRQLGAWPAGADVLVVDRLLPPVPRRDEPLESYVPFIEARLEVAESLEQQVANVRSKAHRRKLSTALKRGFAWRKTREAADFDLFYDRMYEPFVKERFRFDRSIVGREDMRRVFSRRGFLLLLEEDGQAVAGAMMNAPEDNPTSLNYWKYGLADVTSLSPAAFGERNAMTEAMVLKYAVEHRFVEIDFGLTRALPANGIFTHKKRLGCDFRLPAEYSTFSYRVRPEARAHLFQVQPVVVQRRGALSVWMGHTGELSDAAAEALAERLRAGTFPSMQGLVLFADTPSASTRAKLEEILAALNAEVLVPCTLEIVP